MRWWHPLASATGVLCAPFGFAGNQKEEALADSVRVALSNAILDRRPPHVEDLAYGLGYDPANANPFGRLVSLQLRKLW